MSLGIRFRASRFTLLCFASSKINAAVLNSPDAITQAAQPRLNPTSPGDQSSTTKRDVPQRIVDSGRSCSDVAGILNGTERWNAGAGDDAIKQFSYIWDNDLMYCADCLGLKKEDCTSTNQSCEYSIREGSKEVVPAQDARWDAGLWLYAGKTTGIKCGVNGFGCEPTKMTTVCDNSKTSGGFVLMDAMAHLSEKFIYGSTQYDTVQGIVTNEQTKFSSVFAPLPDYSSGRYGVGIFLSVLSSVAGFLPGLNAAKAGLAAGIVGAAASAGYVNSQKTTPADTSEPLAWIMNSTATAFADTSEALFGQGTLKQMDGSDLTMQSLMIGGGLNILPENSNNDTLAQVSIAKSLYQPLAQYAWTNQQANDQQQPPFIAFATGDCDTLDYNDGKSVPFPSISLDKMDANISWGGSCFWLLEAYLDTEDNIPKIAGSLPHCAPKALPGGTNKELSDNAGDFAGLSLIDFIQPSFDGWKQNGMKNGYPTAGVDALTAAGNRAPGAVNITVCDYLANSDLPGIGCPKLVGRQSIGSCQYEHANDIDPGVGLWHDDTCHIHLTEYQRNEPTETNPFPNYQMYMNVADDAFDVIGEAAKEWVDGNIGLWNSPLPDVIWVNLGDKDDSEIQFWYQDQWWTSSNGTDSKKTYGCSSGWYEGGARQMDCLFKCSIPTPNAAPPPSATSAHPMPNVAMQSGLMVGTALAVNNYRNLASPTPTVADYPAGTCRVLVEQYEPGANLALNPDPNVAGMEAYLYTTKPNGDRGDQIAIGDNGQVTFNFQDEGKPIYGVRGSLTVSWPNTSPNTDHSPYYAPLRFNYDGPTTHLQWFGDDQGDRGCNFLNWDTGERQWRSTECKFPCD